MIYRHLIYKTVSYVIKSNFTISDFYPHTVLCCIFILHKWVKQNMDKL